ncbi:MAG: hypothetical protein U0S36_03890 [Candidatus Nanopelagicales bacterium]
MSAVEVVQETPRRYGWSVLVAGLRGLVRGWRVVLPVVVLGALAQALLVWPNPVPGQSWWSYAAGAVSYVLLLVVGALLAASALLSVHGPVHWGPAVAHARRSAGWFALWATVWVAVAAAGLTLWTWPGLLWLAVTPYLLLAASDGRRGALLDDLRAIAARPGRWLLTTVLLVLVCAVAWMIAAIIGFFGGVVLDALLTWLVLGLLGAWFLASWAALWRSTPVGVESDDAAADDAAAPAE